MKCVAILLVLVGCGSDGTSAGSDAGVDGSGSNADSAVDSPGAALALTSPMLTEGATIATANTCDGANTSPQLVWTGNAMNAQSFAVVLTDKTNGLVHAIIYDIPASAAGLPANVEKVYAPTNVPGAHQTDSYTAGMRGYRGPCPPVNGGAHIYELALFGLDVAALPGASMTTTRTQAVALIDQHKTATAKLTGMYMR